MLFFCGLMSFLPTIVGQRWMFSHVNHQSSLRGQDLCGFILKKERKSSGLTWKYKRQLWIGYKPKVIRKHYFLCLTCIISYHPVDSASPMRNFHLHVFETHSDASHKLHKSRNLTVWSDTPSHILYIYNITQPKLKMGVSIFSGWHRFTSFIVLIRY